ncbi:hypothetical protein ACMD2_23320 [Ananas comosus]|uniref:Uncharacterized protein n=1 Tax=Ananas comosus TaxID=4615 RepID=A0A199W5X4_ANACO|nr:hypothetical protein ACMD2_23320 [Ananas comosus]
MSTSFSQTVLWAFEARNQDASFSPTALCCQVAHLVRPPALQGKAIYISWQGWHVGAIDGTYIPVVVRNTKQPRYRCRKGHIAIQKLLEFRELKDPATQPLMQIQLSTNLKTLDMAKYCSGSTVAADAAAL